MTETQVETPLTVEMPDGSIEVYYRAITGQIKIAIIGPPHGGKSRLAATAPKKPIYFWDFDDKLANVAGIKDVFGKTYKDTTNPIQSTAWAEIEKDMNHFEYQKGIGKSIPGTMVFDSITYMSDRVLRKVLTENKNNSKVTTITKVAGKEYLSPNGWDGYKQELNMMGNMIARGVELGCDIIACFHERPEEAEDSTPEKKKFTGKVGVHPPRAVVLLPLFNEYWRILPNYAGTYEVTVKATSDFGGGTCLNIGENGGTEPPDISKMFEKHNKKQQEKEKTNA